jgi:hypothetical protein
MLGARRPELRRFGADGQQRGAFIFVRVRIDAFCSYAA